MRFEIKAYREHEGVVLLDFQSETRDAAIHALEVQGYRILSMRSRLNLMLPSVRTSFSLPLFSQELLSLLEAGIPLLEALDTLGQKDKNTPAGRIHTGLMRLLQEGKAFSEALSTFPEIFPEIFIATIRAAERTGDLPEALRRYLAYRIQVDLVRRKVKSAAIYPALLISVGMLVMVFLLTYVVPRFSHVYEDMGGNLPLLSRLLMAWGQGFETHGGMIVLGFALTGSGLIYWISRPATLAALEKKLWTIPALGERLRIYQLARFYRTVGMLLRGGVPFTRSLDMVAGLLRLPGLQLGLVQARERIGNGGGISESLIAGGLTTEVAERMLRVGERSGNLGEMMERIAGFYDDDMARWVDWFTRLFEPLLMAFIGVIIGAIVLLMYFPIFELAGSIQ